MIIRIATDENFEGAIIRGILRRYPMLDIVRIQDTPLFSKPDRLILDWITQEDRILLTHDKRTMPDFVYERIIMGKNVCGIFVVNTNAPLGLIIDQLSIIIDASDIREWDNLVTFVPFV